MSNLRFFLLCLSALWTAFFVPIQIQAQEHISHSLDLEQEFSLPSELSLHHIGKIIGCMDADRLYFCNAEVVREAKKGYELTLEVVDLESQEVRSVVLQLPPLKRLFSSRYWIYAINVKGDRVLLTTDSQLFEFVLRSEGRAKLVRTVNFPNADYAFAQNGAVYGVSQVNDYGFVLRSLRNDKLDSIAEFPLPVPFILQFGPNGFLKQMDTSLFFVAAPHLSMQRFDLQGRKCGEITLNIAQWNEMPADYIESVSGMQYGGDRAMHIYKTSTPYSFPLELFPLNDTTFLLTYHQYNQERNEFDVRLLWVKTNADWTLSEYKEVVTKFEAEHRIQKEEFPFLYVNRSLACMIASHGRIVQLVKTADSPYVGKTQQEYAAAQEQYFKKNDPILKVRVFRPKNGLPQLKCSDIVLSHYDGSPFAWDSIPTRYSVFCVNNPPQCHACEAELLRNINTLPFEKSSLYIVDGGVDGFLGKKECVSKNKLALKVPFHTLFVPKDEAEQLSHLFPETNFPLLLLYDKTLSTLTILAGRDLFPDNPLELGLKNEAMELLRRYGR